MIAKLKSQWGDLSSEYLEDHLIIDSFWQEILKHYTFKNRYYHNLSHLHNMFIQLEDVKSEIKYLDLLKFSIWYHGIRCAIL
ncbi:hypothetical protein [Winogradskyella bathintestinalis]|uniref:Uncharacterized protein n=1 Tax=Winogradskyella bathintestinalis TaxID=3035208 RepID=A0ABT7ZQV8_9FLAO|nr:hypothetical protein [Winogradskyella bathintestinalis]MDN3491388.1 hypothetical protein [Winogradskyella bathintestinalis]